MASVSSISIDFFTLSIKSLSEYSSKKTLLSKSKAFGYTQENPFIILIDGCNEHPNAEQLFDDILEFLNIHKGGHIKVVLSWRVNTKSELPSVKPEYESLVYVDGSDSSDEKNIVANACHWLKPLNKKEVEGAWDMYTSNKKDKVRRNNNLTVEIQGAVIITSK